MDDMIMTVLGFIVAMIPLITVIVKLNSTITKLDITIKVLSEQMATSQTDRKEIHEQLNDHEIRIVKLEGDKTWTKK